MARIGSDSIVIDVRGVGYKVFLPVAVLSQLPEIGQEIEILTHTVVREDSITLYGFVDEPQQSMFELLTTVSGVGPKVALGILGALEVDTIINAISSESFLELNSAPGVGTKIAQRIVLELREKITTLVWAQAARKTTPDQSLLADAIEGLVALGYNRNDARSAAESALKSVKDKQDTGAVVTLALKTLGK
ncbi:MAG: Holliday junction branch migration protein RuvA [Armatimonadetes bacterium]|nr:Holliday junction branch migration protein RuvA [Armatimonadota bacterium]